MAQQADTFTALHGRRLTLNIVTGGDPVEQAAYGDQLADLQELLDTTTWPGTPSVVLTAGRRSGWVRKQRVLAHRTGARHVVVDDSRHLMMVDRPDAVADAVLGLLPDQERETVGD